MLPSGMPVRTIVVGVDFSAPSELACRQAVAIARRAGARVVLAHAGAIPEEPEGVPASMRATAEAYLKILRDRVADDHAALTELAGRLSGAGVEISQVLVDGFPDDALLAAAQDLGAELIVTGSHGRRGLDRVLLGSVAERVVRGAEVPVLVARGDAAAADGGFRTIVVGTDFSDAADRGLDLAVELAAPGAQIELVHFWAVPTLSRAHAADEVEATVGEIRSGKAQLARDRGAEAVAARAHAPIRYHDVEGDERDGLLAWAAERGADLT